MSTRAEPAKERTAAELEKEWWLRLLMVLQSPPDVFLALRDDSDEAAAARQEPMAAVVFLAGISLFLSTATAGRLYDDVEFDPLLIVVEAVFAGTLVGLQNYWLGGGALHLGARRLGGAGSYRRARHLIGLAMMPLVLSLAVVWPVRLAVFGGDLFRTGGSDGGAGGDVFRGIDAAVAAWGLALLLVGVRTVHGWSWPRSLGALAVAAVVLVLAGLAAIFL